MIPLIPILVLGVTVYGGLKTTEKTQVRKKLQKKLKKADARYQQLIRQHVDTLFGSKQRNQQLEDFSSNYTEKEAKLNRNLGLAVINTGLAVLGEMLYPPLLIVNSLLLLYMVLPLIQHHLQNLLQEKRVKYRLFASITVLLNYLNGFYIIGNLVLAIVFSAFKLAARTEAYSRQSLLNTFNLHTPDSVWVLVEGMEIEIPFEQLRIGDIVVLNAGQTVPIDGILIEGNAMIDQHKLTGESQPVEKSNGDKVFASTLLLSGKIQVRVEQTGAATVATQIGAILNNAADYHSLCETRSEYIADSLTLPMLSTSGLAWLTVSTEGALAILNSGFGSGIIAGPVNMLSYLNIASHSGILVKDGRSLDVLQTIDTVVFDKTGTLTLEQPEVIHIHCCKGWTTQHVLRYAATAEHRQSHPIARAIISAAEQQALKYPAPEHADCALGFGIRVLCQEQTISVGSARFMRQEQIDIPPDIMEPLHQSKETAHSLVMVAVDQQLIGAVELQTQLRPETASLIAQLHQRGLKLYILSGDHHQPTQHLAKRLGINEFFAEVLPEGKADIIQQLQNEGRKVCFVGDGINDAIALRQADVSVSLRGATTMATDSAQIVFVSSSLRQLEQLFDIANDFNNNQKRTLLLAFTPGCSLWVGVFLFHFGLPAALAAYSIALPGALGNALYPLLKFNQQQRENEK